MFNNNAENNTWREDKIKSVFAAADSNEIRNSQCFIHANRYHVFREAAQANP
jgi:hypothetical protein